MYIITFYGDHIKQLDMLLSDSKKNMLFPWLVRSYVPLFLVILKRR